MRLVSPTLTLLIFLLTEEDRISPKNAFRTKLQSGGKPKKNKGKVRMFKIFYSKKEIQRSFE